MDLTQDGWIDALTADEVLIESINVTSLRTHAGELIDRDAHAAFVQEHSCPEHAIGGLAARFRKASRRIKLTPTDPDVARKPTGGVGAIVRRPRTLIEVRPLTDTFKAALKSGRVALYAINLHQGCVLMVWVLYGHTGAASNPKQAAKTAKLLRAVEEEMAAQPRGPQLLLGDLNDDVMHIDYTARLLRQEGPWGGCRLVGASG